MSATDSKAERGLIDQRLAKALSHPLRVELLAILNDRTASPNEMAKALDESLPNVSYHTRVLLDLGCIELVRTAQRRGALEHYYRAIVRPFFTDRDWARLPVSARQSISDIGLKAIWADISKALRSGTFDSRDDRHLSRTTLVVDTQGWGDLTELLAETLDRVMRIEADSAGRIASEGSEALSARAVLLSFEYPGQAS